MEFLGFDFSTQKLKAVVVDENMKIIYESEVDFDRQLPEFRTQGGTCRGDDGVVTSPVTLWIKALDLLLDQMKLNGVDFSRVKALSGAAQQHGSVYWQKNAKKTLQNLDSSQFLFQQLQGCFSLKQSPIWMDSSTSKFCQQMEDALGGPQKLMEITGSRAFERFTGPQIAKLISERSGVYDLTERISLISSFACSLFLGEYANMDYADASGTNLFDIKSKSWNQSCLDALHGKNIYEKLGLPMPPRSNLGNISKYFVERFGFSPDCQVVIFTGDNPATLAGMCLSENDIAISLGTSDTIILPLKEPKTFINGHVMCSAVEVNEWIGLLCFKNGSFTREKLKNLYANGSWETFEKLLYSTPRGNFGNIGLYFDEPEIFPKIKKGEYKWNSKGEKVVKFAAPEFEIRALVEGQFLIRRVYAEELGFTKRDNSKIVATGGASVNAAILQVLSDIFNVPVHVRTFKNSAALGSAYLAKLGIEEKPSVPKNFENTLETELICTPNRDAAQIYDPLMEKLKVCISNLLKAHGADL